MIIKFLQKGIANIFIDNFNVYVIIYHVKFMYRR